MLLANDLDTLLPNFLVSKIFNKKLIYDSHELFTEVPELINKPIIKKVWLNIEKQIIPNLKNCLTVSNSISKYYFEKYKTKFQLIRNFPTEQININSLNNIHKPSIIYQGALNKGRGLELIIETMLYVNNAELKIIGAGDIEQELKQQVNKLNLNNNITFVQKLSPEDLKKLTPTANLGISIEEDLGLNYRYALPNKLFDYIQAEIPVLVSNLPEMSAVVKEYKIGEVVKNRKPKHLAQQIENLLNSKENYIVNLKFAKKELIWEKEEEKLIRFFNNLN